MVAGIPLGLLLSTSLRHVVCFYGWLGGSSMLLYASGISCSTIITLHHSTM